MKKSTEHRKHDDDIRSEYDFAAMKGGVRGKYYERYRKATNVVLLKPELTEAFPTEEAVNEALHGILRTTRAVRLTGGLSDRALTNKRSRR